MKETIASAKVLLEACPPALGDREKAYAVLRQSFSCYNSFQMVGVPDLQDNSEFRRTRELGLTTKDWHGRGWVETAIRLCKRADMWRGREDAIKRKKLAPSTPEEAMDLGWFCLLEGHAASAAPRRET